MRLFFCVVPDHPTCLAIERWRQLNWPLPGRCVPPQYYHVTLAFLGDQPSSTIGLLERLLHNHTFARFSFRLDDLGYFPETGVLWLGCRVVPEPLRQLAQDCRQLANRAGVRCARRGFVPHLTLARRVTTPPSAPFSAPDFEFDVDELLLQESFLSSAGARYQPRLRQAATESFTQR